MPRTSSAKCWSIAAVLGLLGAPLATCQTMSLYSIVDLSLRNSPQIKMAEADVRRAAAGLGEAKDAYLPTFLIGSTPGFAYGFPIGTPTLANVQSNALVFSFSQPDYIRSAHAATDAARFSLRDTREKIALEASLDYIELSTDSQELAILKQQQDFGEQLVQIEDDRVAAGLDQRIDATQARLTNAQLALRAIQLQGHAAVLSERIANLTGLPLTQITADPASIPQPPSDALLTEPVHEGIAVQAAEAAAKSKLFVAFGDRRTVDRPILALGLQYSRFASFDNYAQYYKSFQVNNFGLGVSVTIPLFDESKRQHARGSAADAAHAASEADLARHQESEQKMELSGNLKTLVAQQKVAELQQQLAQDQMDAVSTELTSGTGQAGAPPVTPKAGLQAHLEERRYMINLLDARFQLLQAQLAVLRANDEIEHWAMQEPKP